jgi:hypothetical protein
MGTIVIVDGKFNVHTIFDVPNESILDEAVASQNMFETVTEVWAFSNLTSAPWHATVVSQKKKKRK